VLWFAPPRQLNRWASSFGKAMKLPSEIKSEIQARFERAKESNPGRLSKDRKALHICGSIGFDCYISPDGDVFMETYELSNDEPPVVDRSQHAQIACLILGSEYIPALAQLLPVRPSNASTCETCEGVGWLHRGALGPQGILCHDCSGLGWSGVS
jgi:hypothetical protein